MRTLPLLGSVLRCVALCLAIAAPAAAAGNVPDSLLVTSPPTAPAVHGTLTLEDALRLAARFHPGLAESAWRAEAAAQRVRDAGRFLNPTLEAMFENFGGSLPGNPLETTLSATQTFELGGARGARVRVAEGEQRVAEAELDSRQRAVLAETGQAFVDAWWLEQRVHHLRSFEQIAAGTIVAARERTRIGAAPPVDGLRAQAVEAERAIERRAAEAEMREARRRLALQWGAAAASFDSLVLPPAAVPDLPTPDSLMADLERNPERLRAAAETAVEAARVRAARALRIPDLALHGGVRQFRELSATGFVAGVSLELPLWDRGGARIQAAQAGHRAAEMREHSERLRLEQELRSDWERLMAARDRSEIARTREQPAAQRALADLDRGYRAGRFTFLDQLEGQRAAVEAGLRLLETERDLWNARFELERVLGMSLERAAEAHR